MASGTVVKREYKNKEGEKVQSKHWSIVFRDQDGRQKWETLPGATKEEAQKILRERMGLVDRREYSEKNISFSGLCDKWLDSLKGRGRKHSTLAGYRAVCDLHLKPYFGRCQVRDISTADVEAYVSSKLGGKLSNRSVGYQLGQLKMILKKAVILNYAYKNVCEYVERPQVVCKDVKILSSQEIDRLLTTATGKDRNIILTAVLSGLRAGEIVALSWGRVDLVNGVISIKGDKANYVRGHFETPKAKGSIRDVIIPPALVDALAMVKPDNAADDDLVFTNNAGQPIEWTNWLHRSWTPLLTAGGVPKVKFHSLRHNYVSVLLSAGLDHPFIQRQVGHRDLTTTMNIYAHLLPGKDAGAGQKIQDAFSEYVK